MNSPAVFLDCTFRDGGYYNDWDFAPELVQEYLRAMQSIGVDCVELGFRGFATQGFKGGCAYSTDAYLTSLNVPAGLRIGVMVNASELLGYADGLGNALKELFVPASDSPVQLVRIACHIPEFEAALPAARWLNDMGYTVGFNLMQIASCSNDEISRLAGLASEFPVDVLYFADSLGGMDAIQTTEIIKALRRGWSGALGIHTHDNLGLALTNTLEAMKGGVTWVDSTVTGMGRGPGNAKTEYLAVEMASLRGDTINLSPLMECIRRHFAPLQHVYGWGTNTFYYLAGKYSIHPTYIQEMLSDARYSDEDILSVIEHLKNVGGKKFVAKAMEAGRAFYQGEVKGSWSPVSRIEGREVLILGPGGSVLQHKSAIEQFVRKCKPFVIALNTVESVSQDLVDVRAACHPVRLLADCEHYSGTQIPLVTPASMLPEAVRNALSGVELLDYGIAVKDDVFEIHDTYCVLPSPKVVAYALALASSAKASKVYLAGFDGYGADDPRRKEVDDLFRHYEKNEQAVEVVSITPTKYEIASVSVYAL